MSILFYLFVGSLGIFLALYVLRGLGILSFIPGGILLILLLLAISTGIFWGIQKTTRF